MCKNSLIFLTVSLLSFGSFAYGVNIGSDSAVNEFTTQQQLFNGDVIAGFAWLKSGFSLTGLNTSGTFNSFFPVSGQVALNAGNLILSTDLKFSNNADFYTIGNIAGNNYAIDLSPSVTCISSIASISNSASVSLTTTAVIGTQVVVTAWSYDSQFLAVGVANNAGSEVYLYRYDGISLNLLDSVSIGNHAIDIDWHPSLYQFTLGCAASPQIRVYSINPAAPNLSSVISTFALSAGGFWAQAVNYHPSGNYVAIGTTDTSEQLLLFPVNSNGTLNTGAVVTLSFGVAVSVNTEALNWNTTGEYFAIGCTDSGGTFDELRVYKLIPSPLDFTLNASLLLGDVACVDWLKTSTYVMFTGMNISPRLRSYAHNGAAGTIQFLAGESTNLNTQVRCISADPASSSVAITSNLDASNPEFRIYAYDPSSTPTFTLVSSRNDTANVDALYWAPNSRYISYGNATGTVTVLNRISIPFLDSCFTFSNVSIYLNNDLFIQNSCIQFSGRSAIYGGGNTLTLMPTATLSVGPNSQLKLENITVAGVSGQNFNPIDDTGSFLFNTVNWVLSGNYLFNAGSFIVQDSLTVQGAGNSFQYLTDQVSTVSVFSQLMFDYGTTFSYAPTSNANTLLNLFNTTSSLKLSSALLYVSNAGLNLQKGLFIADGNSFLANSGLNSSQGITFGDGLSRSNNCGITVMPAATLNLLSGFMSYKNLP